MNKVMNMNRITMINYERYEPNFSEGHGFLWVLQWFCHKNLIFLLKPDIFFLNLNIVYGQKLLPAYEVS